MSLPKDPVMLLSWVNTRLRDFYPTLDDLCASEGLNKEDLKMRLSSIDYEYDEKVNRFR